MFALSIGANTISSALLRLLCAATAAYCAIALSTVLLARFTMARFWEPWVRSIGLVVLTWLPVILIASVSGLVFGLILGFIFRTRPTRVAAYAGSLAAIFLLLGGVGLSWVATSAALVLGFLIGGAVVGRITRA
jgi:hypothetical protein